MHTNARLKHLLLIALTVAVALSLGGCGTTETASSDEALSGAAPAMAPSFDGEQRAAGDVAVESLTAPEEMYSYGAGIDAAEVPVADRLVVLTAGLRVNVDDVTAAAEDIRMKVETLGGAITSVQMSSEEDVPIYRYDAQGSLADGAALSGYITARVPADAYEEFLKQIEGVGEIVRQSESEQDVTQEHIDLSARLSNLQAQESRLRDFTGQAKNVEELLAVEQELTRVRAEIDSLTGQVAYLERQAAMSTVTIELVGPRPVVRPAGQSWGFTEALTQSVRAFVSSVNGIIVFAGAIMPVVLIAIVVFLIARAIVRRRRAKAATVDEQAS